MIHAQIKFEQSPAESLADSFVSTPGSSYPLFPPTSADAMTPPFDDEDDLLSQSRSVSVEQTSAPDKPTKKRKSWGQQLPEPKTNLPPRKRAKTEDEKEQRRVERVLRNRRAAQSSRERKRLEVEALEAEKREIERRNRDLELRLADAENKNLLLQQQIAQMTGKVPVFDQPSPIVQQTETYRQPEPTLARELFSSHDTQQQPPSFDQPLLPSQIKAEPQTVNPASVSPEIRPVSESFKAVSSDMTQHPAAMLCDLQCQSEEQLPWMISSPTHNIISVTLVILSMFTATCSTFPASLLAILNSLTTTSYLQPSKAILTTIIWLVTTPLSLTSTSATSSTPISRTMRHPRFSLRMNLLRRLLSCSPHLARPLMDATMGAMRSASEQQLPARDCFGGSASVRDGVEGPSMECLMTLLWATKVIHRQWLRSEKSCATEGTIKDIRQPSLELVDLFKFRTVGMKGTIGNISLSGREAFGTGKRSGTRGVENGE